MNICKTLGKTGQSHHGKPDTAPDYWSISTPVCISPQFSTSGMGQFWRPHNNRALPIGFRVFSEVALGLSIWNPVVPPRGENPRDSLDSS
jgi:hypothetical protein